jgi:hypothetical protein
MIDLSMKYPTEMLSHLDYIQEFDLFKQILAHPNAFGNYINLFTIYNIPLTALGFCLVAVYIQSLTSFFSSYFSNTLFSNKITTQLSGEKNSIQPSCRPYSDLTI